MFASAPDRGSVRTDGIEYADPIAMKLLAGTATPDGSLGAFARSNDGLGFALLPFIGKAIPIVQGLIGQFSRGGEAGEDIVMKVWKALPASAINARVGEGGWWYDLDTNTKLSHEDAARRQQEVVAGTIGASVGEDGWWVDNNDGHQLSHAEAVDRYQALHAGVTPKAGDGGKPWWPSTPGAGTKPTVAGLPISTPMLLVGALAVAAFIMTRKSRG